MDRKYIIAIVIGLVVLVAGIFIAFSGSDGETTLENASDVSNTIGGVKFNTPNGFTLRDNNDTDSIFFVKNGSEISVRSDFTDANSAEEYTKNSTTYYSVVEIENMTFYKSSMWSISIDAIDLGSYEGGRPEGATNYSEYVFDYQGEIFTISIDDDIPNHEEIIKEILGI
ncbi:hypothetical protein [Methanobrevibacter sp. DSM 116169]|uniref:hypothetical protein n=1 Tax=Methanobrevibacter sp. DSM 116169 TaxID=3242727 RepID=UPI0038FD3E09